MLPMLAIKQLKLLPGNDSKPLQHLLQAKSANTVKLPQKYAPPVHLA